MTVSVIIPAYNEEDGIAETISKVQAHGSESVCEILVVDGGSEDDTVSVAQKAGAQVFLSPKKGRAAQMNYGAQQANGDILYFLHADSTPPDHFIKHIKQAIVKGAEAGCFRLAFDEDHPLLNLYAWCTRFDVDAFRFGDQSLFVLQEIFSSIGGFREDHLLMEDNEIVRRIKKGYSFAILEATVETSARTYKKVGIIKLQLIFVLIYCLYFLGVEQKTLMQMRKKAIS